MTKNPTDRELMLRVRDGDRAAFEALVGRYEVGLVHWLHRMVGNRATAEDIFQDTFLRIWKARERYKPTAKFSTWAIRIARNLVVDHSRRMQHRRALSLDAPLADDGGGRVLRLQDTMEGDDTAPLRDLVDEEELQELRRRIRELPETKREAVTLRIHQGLTYQEIADITGSPVGTIKCRVHDALKLLSRWMAPADEGDETAEGGA